VDAVVFDIGGVLLDWDPRYLYRKLFEDEAEMERFLAEVCTMDWHHQHDLGIPFAESCAALAARHPDQAELIHAWGERSEEMEGGEIEATVAILRELREAGVPVYALTNMEQETYPRRRQRYAFMGWFTGTIASYQEGVAKPDPEIFHRLLDRFQLDPRRTLLIDDSAANVRTAASLGFRTIRFQSPEALRTDLHELGLL
jgi:2-haloacid dehalogenase